MEAHRANPLNAKCPSRRFIELVADKWTMLVLWALRDGVKRNGELMRLIDGISQKMLTQTLRQLTAQGLVMRRDLGSVPPHVEYGLSELGRSLAEIMIGFDDWFSTCLDAYDRASDKRGHSSAERYGP